MFLPRQWERWLCLFRTAASFLFLAAGFFAAVGARAQTDTPEKVAVKFLFAFPSPEDTLQLLSRPVALSIDPLGNLYVVDADLHRVLQFRPNGQSIRFVGGIGSGAEQFDSPSDIWAEDGLNVYVTDRNNHRIHLFDRQLNEVRLISIQRFGSEDFPAGFPNGIALSRSGDLFVSELEGNSLLKLSSFWQPIARIGQLESGMQPLERPGQLAIIDDKWVVCVDENAATLLLFDYYGNFLREIRHETWEEPAGLFYWKEKNRLLVADPAGGALYSVRLDGSVTQIRLIDRQEGAQWEFPTDVAGHNNRLFVADGARAQILVYQWIAGPE